MISFSSRRGKFQLLLPNMAFFPSHSNGNSLSYHRKGDPSLHHASNPNQPSIHVQPNSALRNGSALTNALNVIPYPSITLHLQESFRPLPNPLTAGQDGFLTQSKHLLPELTSHPHTKQWQVYRRSPYLLTSFHPFRLSYFPSLLPAFSPQRQLQLGV